MRKVAKVVATGVFWITYGVGWGLTWLAEGANWLSWYCMDYLRHLNEVFDLGVDLPTDEELLEDAMDELREIEESLKDEQDEGEV